MSQNVNSEKNLITSERALYFFVKGNPQRSFYRLFYVEKIKEFCKLVRHTRDLGEEYILSTMYTIVIYKQLTSKITSIKYLV